MATYRATYGYKPLPEPTTVDGLGTEIGFEVHELEDGHPGSIVCFTGQLQTARRIAQLLNEHGEG